MYSWGAQVKLAVLASVAFCYIHILGGGGGGGEGQECVIMALWVTYSIHRLLL